MVIVVGDAHGVGSSTIALDAAHHMSERGLFPGGSIWISSAEVRNDGQPLTLLQRVGLAIGMWNESIGSVESAAFRAANIDSSTAIRPRRDPHVLPPLLSDIIRFPVMKSVSQV